MSIEQPENEWVSLACDSRAFAMGWARLSESTEAPSHPMIVSPHAIEVFRIEDQRCLHRWTVPHHHSRRASSTPEITATTNQVEQSQRTVGEASQHTDVVEHSSNNGRLTTNVVQIPRSLNFIGVMSEREIFRWSLKDMTLNTALSNTITMPDRVIRLHKAHSAARVVVVHSDASISVVDDKLQLQKVKMPKVTNTSQHIQVLASDAVCGIEYGSSGQMVDIISVVVATTADNSLDKNCSGSKINRATLLESSTQLKLYVYGLYRASGIKKSRSPLVAYSADSTVAHKSHRFAPGSVDAQLVSIIPLNLPDQLNTNDKKASSMNVSCRLQLYAAPATVVLLWSDGILQNFAFSRNVDWKSISEEEAPCIRPTWSHIAQGQVVQPLVELVRSVTVVGGPSMDAVAPHVVAMPRDNAVDLWALRYMVRLNSLQCPALSLWSEFVGTKQRSKLSFDVDSRILCVLCGGKAAALQMSSSTAVLSRFAKYGSEGMQDTPNALVGVESSFATIISKVRGEQRAQDEAAIASIVRVTQDSTMSDTVPSTPRRAASEKRRRSASISSVLEKTLESTSSVPSEVLSSISTEDLEHTSKSKLRDRLKQARRVGWREEDRQCWQKCLLEHQHVYNERSQQLSELFSTVDNHQTKHAIRERFTRIVSYFGVTMSGRKQSSMKHAIVSDEYDTQTIRKAISTLLHAWSDIRVGCMNDESISTPLADDDRLENAFATCARTILEHNWVDGTNEEGKLLLQAILDLSDPELVKEGLYKMKSISEQSLVSVCHWIVWYFANQQQTKSKTTENDQEYSLLETLLFALISVPTADVPIEKALGQLSIDETLFLVSALIRLCALTMRKRLNTEQQEKTKDMPLKTPREIAKFMSNLSTDVSFNMDTMTQQSVQMLEWLRFLLDSHLASLLYLATTDSIWHDVLMIGQELLQHYTKLMESMGKTVGPLQHILHRARLPSRPPPDYMIQTIEL